MTKFWKRLSTFARDQAERVGWTLAEAGVAFATVELSSLKGEWVIPIAGALAWLKTIVAKHVGDKGTAGTVAL